MAVCPWVGNVIRLSGAAQAPCSTNQQGKTPHVAMGAVSLPGKTSEWTNPAASGTASVGASPVVNGDSVTCVPWSVASLKNEDPTDVRP